MKNLSYTLLTLILFHLAACRDNDLDEVTAGLDLGNTDIETPDWTENTHGKSAAPNYTVVFPDDQVLRLDLTIDEANWTLMQEDLDTNLGTTGGAGGMGGPGPGGMGPVEIDFTPIWVPCNLAFDGKDWYKVGIRYKGNSSLQSAHQSGTDKYPFKLDFDEFEDTYPAIENQRFYGFKQLNLSSNFNDASFMREKIAADVFRDFGVPAAHTSFCAVYLDHGNGSEFIGLYTLVEEVDDTVIDTQFDDHDGNLYKPDGTAASFALGSYNNEEMDKKTNEDEADYADVMGLYDALHNEVRTTNPTQWQTRLESVFDVDQYLKYLAANNVMQNWDTYGNMTHNYFLYNSQGQLVWIPWDNNEAMQEGKMGGNLSLGMSEVSAEWPIIRYVIDVEAYNDQYKSNLELFVSNAFEPTKIQGLLETYQALISDYALQESSGFESAVSTLKIHATNRKNEVISFLE